MTYFSGGRKPFVLLRRDLGEAFARVLQKHPRPFILRLGFVISFVCGFAAWYYSLQLTGEAEPWDSNLSVLFILPGGAFGMILNCKPHWIIPSLVVGLWVGQSLAILTLPQLAVRGPLMIVGMIAALVISVMCTSLGYSCGVALKIGLLVVRTRCARLWSRRG
jgi:hypothetical protein